MNRDEEELGSRTSYRNPRHGSNIGKTLHYEPLRYIQSLFCGILLQARINFQNVIYLHDKLYVCKLFVSKLAKKL